MHDRKDIFGQHKSELQTRKYPLRQGCVQTPQNIVARLTHMQSFNQIARGDDERSGKGEENKKKKGH